MHPVFVKNFGCKVNLSETIGFSRLARSHGYVPVELGGPANLAGVENPVVFINSCAVTATAEKKVLDFARRILKKTPQATVIVTGCLVRSPLYAGSDARLIAVNDFGVAAERLLALPMPTWEHHTIGAEQTGVEMRRTRAFVKVQDGCRSMCSYCIIPHLRKFTSVPWQSVRSEVEQCLSEGTREIVVTGVNLGTYRDDDAEMRLSDLVAATADLAAAAGARVRLSSVETEDIDERILSLFEHTAVCPHLHMPLQSGSDAVLQAMRRRYSAAEFIRAAEAFRERYPDGGLTSDAMVGYPTESDADFAETIALVERLGFERTHVFPYSPRPLTPSAGLPPLPHGVVNRRKHALIETGQRVAEERLSRFIGRTLDVLVDDDRGGFLAGYGPGYQPVAVPKTGADASSEPPLGVIKAVKVVKYEGQKLVGTFADRNN
jgi:threonylcarbamoyladenosine tRNA methylthiotransferase MtaB